MVFALPRVIDISWLAILFTGEIVLIWNKMKGNGVQLFNISRPECSR